MKKIHVLFFLFMGILTMSMSSCSINEEDEFLTEIQATGGEDDDPALPDDD